MKILRVLNSGNIDNEHVFLRVEADIDVSDYLLTDSTHDAEGNPANRLRHVFFFPSKMLKTGEYVVVWTRGGKYGVSRTTGGAPQHNFYWNLRRTIWNRSAGSVYLAKAPREQRVEFALPGK